jgi:hypothetical protein
MAEHELELELRLRAVARDLDARAPGFDYRLLRAAPRPRMRRPVVALVCVVALIGAAASPAGIAALRTLFDVDTVRELGPLAPGVAPPFAGRSVPVESIHASVPFPVRTLSSLGAPADARVRDDISGGLATLVYAGGIRLTQWRTIDVHARIALVPVDGIAEELSVGALPALWIQGTARGTFTLVGADGAVHRESFDIGAGVLMWKQDGMTFLLQGVSSKPDAVSLAAGIGR